MKNIKAENYVCRWCDLTYKGGKELGDWTTAEVMKFANDLLLENLRLPADDNSLYLPTKDEIIKTLYNCAKIEKTNEGTKIERFFDREAEAVLSLIKGKEQNSNVIHSFSIEDLRKAFEDARKGGMKKIPMIIDQYGSVNIEEHYVSDLYTTFDEWYEKNYKSYL